MDVWRRLVTHFSTFGISIVQHVSTPSQNINGGHSIDLASAQFSH
jgi:hypothetical protein